MASRKKRDTRCVLMRDGSPKRVPPETAKRLIESGQARQYISKTVFRALELGLDVEDPSTLDEDGLLRERIQGAHQRAMRKRKREDERRAREEFELFEDDAA